MALKAITQFTLQTSISAADWIGFDDVSTGITSRVTFANFKASLSLGTAAALNVGTGANQIVQLTGDAQIAASLIPNGMAFDSDWGVDADVGDKTVSIPAFNGSGGYDGAADQALVAVVKAVKALKTALHSRLIPDAI